MRRRLSLPVNYDAQSKPTAVIPAGQTCVGKNADLPNNTMKSQDKGSGRGRSRYEEDFIELEKLGRGGYGAVYAVKHKLDGLMYAMKKIQFKNTSSQFMEKVLREVKTLALLSHPNVVRYHSAWLERSEDTIEPPTPISITPTKGRKVSTDNSDDEYSYSSDDEISTPSDEHWSDSDDDMEQFNFKLEDDLTWPTSNSTELCSPRGEREREREAEQLLPIKKPQLCTPQNFDPTTARHPKPKGSATRISRTTQRMKNDNTTTLFIVMQLYSTTLAQWLDRRSPDMVDTRQNIHIFHQISIFNNYFPSCGV